MTGDNGNLPGMIGRHPAMLDVYRQTRLAARCDLPVLIVGETGTGKELVARALHELSPAARGPFVDINCAALPESLAEAELFGSERGAFTGATQPVAGFLELANGGTLFLDEACSLSPSVQAKLLRAIELQEFWRVGGRQRRRSHFWPVTAVARPADELVASRVWRPDFAHRVAGHTITIPPLRARHGDLEVLAVHFLRDTSRKGGAGKCLTPDALLALGGYGWPGNVRELRMVCERLAVSVDGETIAALDVMAVLPATRRRPTQPEELCATLEAHGWDVARAARVLGVGRSTLYKLMHRHGLRQPAGLV